MDFPKPIEISRLPLRNHLSKSKIEQLQDRRQEKELNYRFYPNMPQGLWYGFKDSWINWIHPYKSNFVLLEKGENLYKLIIPEENFCHIEDTVSCQKVLRLCDKEEYDLFYSKYAASYYQCYEPTNILSEAESVQPECINWSKVAKNYAGIELPFYNKKKDGFLYQGGYKPRFMAGWEVPSGCIWHVSVIKQWSLFQ